jgi:hypothetical protein
VSLKPSPKNALAARELERTRSQAVVVPLTVQVRKMRGFVVWSVLILVGSLALAVSLPATQTIGGAAVLWLIFPLVWAQAFVNRRRQMELVISDDAVSTPFWSLPLERIEQIELGQTSPGTGALEALFIRPYRREDVILAPKGIMRLNRAFTRDPSP